MRTVALLLLLAPSLLAGPKSTHLVGAIYLPDGTAPSAANLTIQLTKSIVVGDTTSPTTTYTFGVLSQTTVITPSSVSIYLAPTTGSTPTGAYYTVNVSTSSGSFTQTWDVPYSTSDVRISDCVVP